MMRAAFVGTEQKVPLVASPVIPLMGSARNECHDD